jgi:hypothetical protein
MYATMPPKKKARAAAKFQEREWTMKYGLQVSTRDPSTKEVKSMLCLFCKHFGREDVAGDKDVRNCKQTTDEKYFCSPWRTDNFLPHLRKQHAAKWVEYQNLICEEKREHVVEIGSEQVIKCDHLYSQKQA